MNPDSSDQAWKGHNAAITAAMTPEQRGHGSSDEPMPSGETGVGAAMALADSVEAARLCRLGYHAWTPWLANPNGMSFWTYCVRCSHQEQFDL